MTVFSFSEFCASHPRLINLDFKDYFCGLQAQQFKSVFQLIKLARREATKLLKNFGSTSVFGARKREAAEESVTEHIYQIFWTAIPIQML